MKYEILSLKKITLIHTQTIHKKTLKWYHHHLQQTIITKKKQS